MDEPDETRSVPAETEVVEVAAAPVPPAPPVDPVNRVLSAAGLALAGIALLELLGTTTVGLAVKVQRMNFPVRQGYAFLTQLEKSPVGLVLVVAAVFASIAALRAVEGDAPLARVALWVVVVGGALLGVATILAVMARFRVAQIVASQPVDALTRRVLVVFVIRNFGAAVIAVLLAIGTLFQRPRDVA
jgi:hypothetical protein